MEFKEHGPLVQSKVMATNQKTSWVPKAVMLGLGIIMGIAWINMVTDNQSLNKKDNRSKGI